MKHMWIKWLPANSKKGFSLLAGINRVIKPMQTAKMAVSIKRMGVVRPVVIAEIAFLTGKKERYIIDGQHLYMACLKLSIDVPYITVKIKDKRDLVETIAMLNNTSKSWCMFDYVTAWSSIEPDYVKLNTYSTKYNFEFSILAAVLGGKIGTFGGTINQMVKRGEFRITNEYHATKLLNWMTDVINLLPKASRYETKYICSEYLTFVSNCHNYKDKHEKLVEAIEQNKQCLSIATQAEGKLSEIFKSLLNGKSKKNQRKTSLRRAA